MCQVKTMQCDVFLVNQYIFLNFTTFGFERQEDSLGGRSSFLYRGDTGLSRSCLHPHSDSDFSTEATQGCLLSLILIMIMILIFILILILNRSLSTCWSLSIGVTQGCPHSQRDPDPDPHFSTRSWSPSSSWFWFRSLSTSWSSSSPWSGS